MAAPRMECIVQIDEMLNDDDDNPLPNTPAILRVPTPLLEMKPEAYIPRFVSFGPYHFSKLEKDSNSQRAFKCKFNVMLSNELQSRGKSFDSIVEMMKRMRREIESFYRWPTSTDGESSQNFALMMAIDSSLLLRVLIIMSHNFELKFWLDDEMKSFRTIYFSCIRHDILKMENQIPLFVLKEVFDYVKEALRVDESLPFNHLLGMTCYVFSPFPFKYLDIAKNERNKLIDAMGKEPHFLGCVHKSLSLFLQRGEEHHRHMQHGSEERMRILLHKFNSILKSLVTWIRCFLPETSAVHLDKAGIKFKSFSKMPHYIRLDKESSTLYLPHIAVGEIGTEVWLRNLMALEFNDAPRPKYVTRYVALMGTLVQSPHDVRLLVDRQLLSRSVHSDESIAQMWHDLCQPFLTDSLTEVHSELLQTFIVDFVKSYWNKIATKVSGVYYRYWNKIATKVSSWKFIAQLIAFLSLLLTAIQTYCSLYHCSR